MFFVRLRSSDSVTVFCGLIVFIRHPTTNLPLACSSARSWINTLQSNRRESLYLHFCNLTPHSFSNLTPHLSQWLWQRFFFPISRLGGAHSLWRRDCFDSGRLRTLSVVESWCGWICSWSMLTWVIHSDFFCISVVMSYFLFIILFLFLWALGCLCFLVLFSVDLNTFI